MSDYFLSVKIHKCLTAIKLGQLDFFVYFPIRCSYNRYLYCYFITYSILSWKFKYYFSGRHNLETLMKWLKMKKLFCRLINIYIFEMFF